MNLKKLTVAVDIDETLSDHAEDFIKFSNSIHGTNLKVTDYSEHWSEMFSIDARGVENLYLKLNDQGMYRELKHKVDSVNVLNKLKQKYELIIVTSRKTMLREDTLEWLSHRYPGVFSDVHFAGIWDEINDKSIHLTKKEIIQQVGADFLIDDQPKHCEAVANAGVQAILFGDYAWNRDYMPHKNLIKLHDWAAVGEYLWNLDLK